MEHFSLAGSPFFTQLPVPERHGAETAQTCPPSWVRRGGSPALMLRRQTELLAHKLRSAWWSLSALGGCPQVPARPARVVFPWGAAWTQSHPLTPFPAAPGCFGWDPGLAFHFPRKLGQGLLSAAGVSSRALAPGPPPRVAGAQEPRALQLSSAKGTSSFTPSSLAAGARLSCPPAFSIPPSPTAGS